MAIGEECNAPLDEYDIQNVTNGTLTHMLNNNVPIPIVSVLYIFTRIITKIHFNTVIRGIMLFAIEKTNE